jgi:hypothetical protein
VSNADEEPAATPPSSATDAGPAADLLHPGTKVEVLGRFDGQWAGGFEVVSGGPEGYRLRRTSDGSELPAVFGPENLRRERRRQTWWV